MHRCASAVHIFCFANLDKLLAVPQCRKFLTFLAGVATQNSSRLIIIGLLENAQLAAALLATPLLEPQDMIAFTSWTCASISKHMRRLLNPYANLFADGVRRAAVAVLAVLSKYEMNGQVLAWHMIHRFFADLFATA